MSLKIESVVTGSVLLMSDANNMASRSVKGKESPKVRGFRVQGSRFRVQGSGFRV
jgi:hypothetical protein